jgi:hypothetical protein
MNSSVAGPNVAVGRAGAISAMLASSTSAELLYEPGELALARQTSSAVSSSTQSGAGRALRYAGLRARPPPDPQRQ